MLLVHIVLTLYALTVSTKGADSPLALELDVPTVDPGERVLRYRLVGLAWLRYLRYTGSPEIWLKLSRLPNTFNGMELTPDDETNDKSDYGMVREDAALAIIELAEQVLRVYLREGIKASEETIVHTDGSVDEKGVILNLLPIEVQGNEDLRRYWFNRTIEIDFRDPPYGQSRANLLVTDKNVAWHDLASRRFKLTRNFTRIDTTDLRYRYAHNIGHTLGFGHFVGTERTRPNGNRRGVRVELPFRSVMVADTKDANRASQFVTDQDKKIIQYVHRYLDELTEKSLYEKTRSRVEKEAIEFVREAHPITNSTRNVKN